METVVTFEVIPETPENNARKRQEEQGAQRRSRRRSTMLNTLASDGLRSGCHNSHRIEETPEMKDLSSSSSRNMRNRRKTVMVPESPLEEEDQPTRSQGTSSQATNSSLAVVHQRHPIFQGGAKELESEETFVQYVGATQDLASTHLAAPKGSGGRKKTRRSSNDEDKVAKWLRENQGQLRISRSREKSILSPKKRENLAQDLCQALIGTDNNDKSFHPPQESRRKSRRRTSSIMENASAMLNSPKTRLMPDLNTSKKSNKAPLLSQPSFGSSLSSQRNIRRSVAGVLNFLDNDNDDDDVFFRPANASTENMEETECVGGIEKTKTGGGLVDFSSDSAKALIAEYESQFRQNNKSISSLCSEASAKAAEAAARVVKTKSGGLVDFSSDSAKALIAQYEAKMAGDSSNGNVVANESGPKEHVEDRNNDEEEGLPATQPSLSLVLQGVTAYVEFRTGHENRSRCVEEVLESMGATVAMKLGKDVTHMVFKDGALATYNKGKKLGIHIVSNMWVEACKNEGSKVSEGLFPSTSKAKYDSPGLFPKIRKAKSMQPKSDEELRQQLEVQMRRKRRKKSNKKDGEGDETDGAAVANPKTPTVSYPVPLDFYNSPRPPMASPTRQRKRDSVLNILDEARGEEGAMMVLTSPARARLNTSQESGRLTASPCTSEDFNTPLARRLVKKYFSPATATGSGPRVKDNDSLRRRLVACSPELPRRASTSRIRHDNNEKSDTEDIVDLPNNTSQRHQQEERSSEAEEIADLANCSSGGISGVEVLAKRNSNNSSANNNTRRSSKRKSSEVSKKTGPKSKSGVKTTKAKGRKRKQSCERTVGAAPDDGQHKESHNKIAEGEATEDDVGLILADQIADRLTGDSRVKPNKKHLFTQNGILSETPSATPSTKLKTENVHTKKKKVQENLKKCKRTKIIKSVEGDNVALPPETDFKVPKSNVVVKKRGRRKGSIESEGSEASSFCSRKHVSRRSSVDFVKQDELSRRKRKSSKVARNCIVATSLLQEDTQLLKQLLKSLGRFTLQEGGQVTAATSHVVCGVPVRRTINLLKGLSRGCWLLSRDWLFASLEKGRWADEEDFELVNFSPVVRRARQEREAFGRRSSDLLKNLPAMYFSPRGCRAPAEDLRQLALLSGAELARVARAAGLVVGEKVRRQSSEGEDVVCVKESWFFDSLQRQEVLPFDGHLL